MRRTPLFGFDGNLGIPIIPSKSKQPSTSNSTSSSSNSQQKSSSSGKQKSNTKFGSYSVPHTDYSNSKVGLGSEMIIVIPFYLSFQTPTCKIHRHCMRTSYMHSGFKHYVQGYSKNIYCQCWKLKSDNLQCNTLDHWAKHSSTMQLMFQVFFFHSFLQTQGTQNSLFLFMYFF